VSTRGRVIGGVTGDFLPPQISKQNLSLYIEGRENTRITRGHPSSPPMTTTAAGGRDGGGLTSQHHKIFAVNPNLEDLIQ